MLLQMLRNMMKRLGTVLDGLIAACETSLLPPLILMSSPASGPVQPRPAHACDVCCLHTCPVHGQYTRLAGCMVSFPDTKCLDNQVAKLQAHERHAGQVHGSYLVNLADLFACILRELQHGIHWSGELSSSSPQTEPKHPKCAQMRREHMSL